MSTAVFCIIGFAAISIQMQAVLACTDLAFRILTGSICPTSNFNRTVSVVVAAVFGFICFTAVLEEMASCNTG